MKGREDLLTILNAIEPIDDLEKLHIKQGAEWISSGIEIYRIKKPDVPPKHLIIYSVVIDPNEKAILLGAHKKSSLWLPPGGHLDKGEDPKSAACRELEEELGAHLPLVQEEPFFFSETETIGSTAGHIDVGFWYLFKGVRGEVFPFDKREFSECKWFLLGSLPSSDIHMERFQTKLEAFLGS